VTAAIKPWGRGATFALAAVALLAGQMVALLALTWWYGQSLGHLPNFSGDGAAISLIIAVSTPVEVGCWRCSPAAQARAPPTISG